MEFYPSENEIVEIDKALTKGIPLQLALKAAGVEPERMRKIEQLARNGAEPYKTWVGSIEQSVARAKIDHLMKVADSPDWRARKDMLRLTDPSLFDGSNAEFQKTYDFMLKVIAEETDEETLDRILTRFATEDPGETVEAQATEEAEG
jgi:hypothetical protein